MNQVLPKTDDRPQPLQRFAALLGEDVFFVPCRWGTKKPLTTYKKRSFESTKTPDYRGLFRNGQANIAVYLGKASAGLCAIDLDADIDRDTFLEVNPRLKSTTQSRASRGAQLLIRIVGDYPPSCDEPHKHFEWRADLRLSTIYGRHPKGMDYTLVVDAAPVEIPFAELVWPAGWELPWLGAGAQDVREALVREFGEPFYTNKDGKVTGINERYWAGLYARENQVIFDSDERTFFLYRETNGLWQPVTPDTIRDTISRRILEISRETGQGSLELQITQAKLKAVVSALRGIVEKRGAFKEKQRCIHVANGVVRFLKDGDVQFGGFAPEDYSRNQSPYAFDPDAECPRFLNELIYPAVSPEDADLLQRWAGVALFGYNLPQRFLILDGTPNGGKGTLVRVIQALVGIENTYQLRTGCLTERFETFRYRWKTLLIGPDVDGDFLMQRGASMIKVLVGGDPLSAEGKGLNGDYPMYGTFNIVMTCNTRLRIRLDADAGAWRRRLLLVRYENPPPAKRILDFHRVLLDEEGNGILRWALAGFVKQQEEFAKVGDFVLSDVQRERVNSLLAESDSLRLFARSRIVRDVSGKITTSDFQQAYAEFCADKGWSPLPFTAGEQTAADAMLDVWQVPKCHCVKRGGKDGRGWKRVRLVASNHAGGAAA